MTNAQICMILGGMMLHAYFLTNTNYEALIILAVVFFLCGGFLAVFL